MNPPAKLSELMEAIEFESMEGEIRFDRQTGQIVRVEESILSAAEEGDEDQLADTPDWQKEEVEIARAIVADVEGKRFIDPPDQSGFHEYSHMERFPMTRPPTSFGATSRGGAPFAISKTPSIAWDFANDGSVIATRC